MTDFSDLGNLERSQLPRNENIRKGKKMILETTGTLVSLQPGKVMKKILEGIEKHWEDNVVADHSQHHFMRGNSCLSNLIFIYNKVTPLADQGKPVDVIFLDVNKSFDTVPHRILLEKMSSTQKDKHITIRESSWFMGQAQRVTLNGVTSEW